MQDVIILQIPFYRKDFFMQDFFQNIDWYLILKAFIVGGSICVIGQVLIDKTKLTPARILVIFVTTGVILRRSWNI